MHRTPEPLRGQPRALVRIHRADLRPGELPVPLEGALEHDGVAIDGAIRSERQIAARAEQREERALRRDRAPRIAVVQHPRDSRAQTGVVRTQLDSERALPCRGRELVGVKHLVFAHRDAKPAQSRHRDDHGVVLTLLNLAQARVDVPADLARHRIRTKRAQQCGPAWARRPDDRRAGQAGQASARARDEGVARIRARRDRRDHEVLDWRRR